MRYDISGGVMALLGVLIHHLRTILALLLLIAFLFLWAYAYDR
jgi:hypothetical protein